VASGVVSVLDDIAVLYGSTPSIAHLQSCDLEEWPMDSVWPIHVTFPREDLSRDRTRPNIISRPMSFDRSFENHLVISLSTWDLVCRPERCLSTSSSFSLGLLINEALDMLHKCFHTVTPSTNRRIAHHQQLLLALVRCPSIALSKIILPLL